MTVTRRITGCRCRAANQRCNYECSWIVHSSLFVSLCHCREENKKVRMRRVKQWEINPDNLSKAGWSYGYVSAVDREGANDLDCGRARLRQTVHRPCR